MNSYDSHLHFFHIISTAPSCQLTTTSGRNTMHAKAGAFEWLANDLPVRRVLYCEYLEYAKEPS